MDPMVAIEVQKKHSEAGAGYASGRGFPLVLIGEDNTESKDKGRSGREPAQCSKAQRMMRTKMKRRRGKRVSRKKDVFLVSSVLDKKAGRTLRVPGRAKC